MNELSHPLPYELIERDGARLLSLVDLPPLNTYDVMEWMAEVRDDDPDLFHELFCIYNQLTKSNYTKEG